MVHFWGSKAREETDLSKSALGDKATGDVAVVVGGEQLDTNLVYLGCQLAKGARRRVHLVHIIQVPRTLPLNAVMEQKSDQADKLLNLAMQIAEKVGCEAVAEIVQARDAGPAIVDEARDHDCSLILIGLVRHGKQVSDDTSKAVQYVLTNSPCRVWLVQDPCPQGTQNGNGSFAGTGVGTGTKA